MNNFNKKNSSVDEMSAASHSFLGKGTIMTGTLIFPGSLTYHGHFKGNIISSGKLIVGETGEIESEISVGTALNAGEIRGSITASEKVQILPYGKISGTVKTPDLQIESGAVFNGKSEMPAVAPRVFSKEVESKREGKGEKAHKANIRRNKPPAKPHGSSGHPIAKKQVFIPIFAVIASLLLASGIGLFKNQIFSNTTSETPNVASQPKKKTVQTVAAPKMASKAAQNIEKKNNKRKRPRNKQVSTLPPAKKKFDVAPVKLKAVAPPPKKVGIKQNRSPKKRVAMKKNKENLKAPVSRNKESPQAFPKKEPKSVDVGELKKLASFQLSRGENIKAIGTLTKILDVTPDDSNINLKLARLYFISGNEKQAEYHFSKQEKLDPSNIETRNNEGFRQFFKKRNEKALSIFKRVLRADPGNIRARFGLATVYAKQNFHEKAIRICKNTLKETPQIIPFRNKLAQLYGKKKPRAVQPGFSKDSLADFAIPPARPSGISHLIDKKESSTVASLKKSIEYSAESDPFVR